MSTADIIGGVLFGICLTVGFIGGVYLGMQL